MRHRIYGYKLGLDKDERERLFKSLITSLLLHGTVETSDKKAKAIKGQIDKIINLAKNKNTQRFLQSYLANRDLRDRLIKDIVPKLGNRTSGYTSLVRLGTRVGDRSMMVRMSLIGAEEMKPTEKVSKEEKVSIVSKVKPTPKKSVSKTLRNSDRKQGNAKTQKARKRRSSVSR